MTSAALLHPSLLLPRLRRMPRWLIISLIALLVLVALRLALPWALAWGMNRALAADGAYQGHVGGVSLSLWRGAYQVHDLALTVKRKDGKPKPLLDVPRLDIAISWSELVHGRIRSSLHIERPKLIIAPSGPADRGEAELPPPKDPEGKPSGGPEERWQERVRSVVAFRIDELLIDDGTISYRDEGRSVDLELGRFAAAIHGLAGGRGAQDEPAIFNLQGTTTGGGALRIEGSARPWSDDPDFDVRAALERASLPALNASARYFNGLQFRSGTVSAFCELHASRGSLDGYVKPLFSDLDIAAYGDDADNPAKKAFRKAVIALGEAVLPNDDTGALAARVPVHGRFDHPRTDLWTVIGSALGNAFLAAILPGFEGMDRFTAG